METSQVLGKFYRTKQIKNSEGKSDELAIRVLPALQGMTVANKLLKVILPAIGGTVDGMQHEDLLHGTPNNFTNLALTICQQIDKVDIENLIIVLLQDSTINGNDLNIDEYFASNYGAMVETLEFCLKENFTSFFTGRDIKALLSQLFQSLMVNTQAE